MDKYRALPENLLVSQHLECWAVLPGAMTLDRVFMYGHICWFLSMQCAQVLSYAAPVPHNLFLLEFCLESLEGQGHGSIQAN